MNISSVCPDVLSRLLLIPGTLKTLPEINAMTSYLESALRQVPGIGDITLCLNDIFSHTHFPSSPNGYPQTTSSHQNPLSLEYYSDSYSPDCERAKASRRRVIPLETIHCCNGYVVIEVDDPGAFAVYEPYIHNIIHCVATLLENRTLRQQLQFTNHRLNTLLDHLEQQVEERTQALNEEIAQRKVLETDLRDSQAQLLEAQYISKIGAFTWNIATNEVSWSNGMYRLLKYSPDETFTIARIHDEIHHPDDRDRITQWLEDGMASGAADLVPNEYRLICKDGASIDVQTNARIEYCDGEAVKLFGTCQDITERKRSEEKLQLAAKVFTHAREGILITDSDGTIIEVNEAFTEITGYSRNEALGQNPRLLKSDRHGPEFYKLLWHDLLEKGYWCGEIWNRRKDGRLYAEMLTISAVRDAQDKTQNYVALFSDITSQKEHQHQLEQIAHYDALTNLPNRVLLAACLQQSMMRAHQSGYQLAVAYLDLDGFKAVNDTHGHEVGDQLLKAIATSMSHSLRKDDTIARLGGDEFVIVLNEVNDLNASLPILNRLLDAAARPIRVGDLTLQVSASLGVTFYPQYEGIDADQLLRQADQAMYQAKLAGKNRYHIFDAEQDRSMRNYHETLKSVRYALDHREFILYYQPKVNMRTGKIVGAEALIRWQHPERGFLFPGDFLNVIENHPIAIELGEWIIDTALCQLEEWHEAGLDISVSVNVDAYQLQQDTFISRLGELIAAHPTIEPGDLELEVLETSALEDIAQVSQVIRNCQDIGVSFALDDFGTGYSSLTHLKHLPAAQLKIDQSFVCNMLEDPLDLAILEGVIGLATAFHREVIAEGVETAEHGEKLLQLGCEIAQGYGIARPMPAHQVLGWSQVWRPDPSWRNQYQLPSLDSGYLKLP